MCEFGAVILGNKNPRNFVFDCLGDAAVEGCERGNAHRHGLKHGIGYPFLVAVGVGAGGVEEEVAIGEQPFYSVLVEEA